MANGLRFLILTEKRQRLRANERDKQTLAFSMALNSAINAIHKSEHSLVIPSMRQPIKHGEPMGNRSAYTR